MNLWSIRTVSNSVLIPSSTRVPAELGVVLDDVAELCLDPDHRIERIHAALEDGRDVGPAQGAQIVL